MIWRAPGRTFCPAPPHLHSPAPPGEGAAKAPEADTGTWEAFVRRAIEFGASGLRLGKRKMAPQEAEQYLRFVIHLFQSFEAPHVSRVMLQLVKIQLWYALSEPRRELELVRHPEAAAYWKKMSRKDQKAAKKAKEQVRVVSGWGISIGCAWVLHVNRGQTLRGGAAAAGFCGVGGAMHAIAQLLCLHELECDADVLGGSAGQCGQCVSCTAPCASHLNGVALKETIVIAGGRVHLGAGAPGDDVPARAHRPLPRAAAESYQVPGDQI